MSRLNPLLDLSPRFNWNLVTVGFDTNTGIRREGRRRVDRYKKKLIRILDILFFRYLWNKWNFAFIRWSGKYRVPR